MKYGVYIFSLLILLGTSCKNRYTIADAVSVDSLPEIWPDYVGVTIPRQIAPLDFCMLDELFDAMQVIVEDKNGHRLTHQGADADFDIKEWQKLIEPLGGDSLQVLVTARKEGIWYEYKPFPIYISTFDIDPYISYRLIEPGYERAGKMKICQRDLASFAETEIFDNKRIANSCVNCHSYNQCNPEDFNMHVRGDKGGTILRQNGNITYLNTKTPSTITACVYPYWHPSGNYIAYTNDLLRQSFYARLDHDFEACDAASDALIYDIQRNKLIKSARLASDKQFENYPVFSPDGSNLYFLTSRQYEIPEGIDSIQFSLCRMDFDAETGQLGEIVDTIVPAAKEGWSLSTPRPSFDGRFILYARATHGYLMLYQKDADLWLYDLKNHCHIELPEVNSDDAESWHSWSSNSRWIVLASKREDGWFTRLYLASIDENGRATKAFMLPQRHPREYYMQLFFGYNIPEFSIESVDLDAHAVERNLRNPMRKQMEIELRP